ncbi:MAG TPA: hypothetical protein VFY87_02455 [Geminicoccaceae bacterium]|nr:hypothetical protein [Geminicoccaceae bacterium]
MVLGVGLELGVDAPVEPGDRGRDGRQPVELQAQQEAVVALEPPLQRMRERR